VVRNAARPLHPGEVHQITPSREEARGGIFRALPVASIPDRDRELAPSAIGQYRVHFEAAARTDRLRQSWRLIWRVERRLDLALVPAEQLAERFVKVRFAAHCGLNSDIGRGPKGANKRLMHRSKQQLYSITSSARVSSVGGTMMPSAFAVFKLMTSSNLVGCSTGRSAGFAPLKILSTKAADRR
jgi:hypothetical protein